MPDLIISLAALAPTQRNGNSNVAVGTMLSSVV